MNGPHRYPAGEYTGLGVFREPPRGEGPSKRLVLVMGVLLGVLLTAGAIWLFGPASVRHTPSAAEPASRPPAEQSGVAGAAANQQPYPVGTCLYETPGRQPGSVALRVTDCASGDAVFMINHVARDKLGCARHGDYAKYGLIQEDTSAGSVYCLSLVVPLDGCLRLAGGVAPQRAECTEGTRRVAEIRVGDDPSTACADLSGADPWYHRDPRSGEVSCVIPEVG